MTVLILGGTGTMGGGILKRLGERGCQITVTSRRSHASPASNIQFVKGNAKELPFLTELLNKSYDAIIDFMVYTTEEFRQRYELFLSHTAQYIFISSARVYAQSDSPITENSPRLLDISTDQKYLSTDEYALAKARCEDILGSSGQKNYTIIRPYITYGTNRLQLGVLEKENWLYRALHGRSIVFSEDIAGKYTTLTYGRDVADGICSLLGKPETYGEIFHITHEQPSTWNGILNLYADVLEKETGRRPNIVINQKAVNLKLRGAKYQVIFCRYFDRRFDNSKVSEFVNVKDFKDTESGLKECLIDFLNNPHFREINWVLEALNDRVAHEHTPLKEITDFKSKMVYLCYRYHLEFIIKIYKKIELILFKKNQN